MSLDIKEFIQLFKLYKQLKKMKNWKTTLSGVGAIALGIYLITQGKVTEGVSSIMAGLGCLSAKDFNVTGGTKPQTEEAEVRTEK